MKLRWLLGGCGPALVVALATDARGAPVLVLDDPLTKPSGAGQTVSGGSFGPGGWKRDSFESQIVYDLGHAIVSGRVTFEMDGVNGINHGVGGFPDCRAIFAALDNNGSGDLEQAGNENVQYLWAWAMEETDYCNGGPGGLERTNRMKLIVQTAGPNNPGEPMSDPLVWDAATFYSYEIGWDQAHAWLLRDGVTVLDQVYLAPVAMNMRYLFLGTLHRYDAGVKEATYRNLKVWDDEPIVVEPDAGAPDAGTSCASIGTLSPQNGSGTSATLTVSYTRCQGPSAPGTVELWVGELGAGVPALRVRLANGLLFIDGNDQSCAPGAKQTLTASYGSLDCSATSATVSGNTSSVAWALTFDPSFAGTHPVFARASDSADWMNVGTFTVSGQADAGNPARGSTSADDSGCGCRLAPTPTAPRAIAALCAMLAWLAARRRRG